MIAVLEELHKVNPKDEKIAKSLFGSYLANNSFLKMSGLAMKLQMQFGHKEYGLYYIEALYLFAKSGEAMANTADLTLMMVEKYKSGMTETPDLNFMSLYVNILLLKSKYEEAKKYIME